MAARRVAFCSLGCGSSSGVHARPNGETCPKWQCCRTFHVLVPGCSGDAVHSCVLWGVWDVRSGPTRAGVRGVSCGRRVACASCRGSGGRRDWQGQFSVECACRARGVEGPCIARACADGAGGGGSRGCRDELRWGWGTGGYTFVAAQSAMSVGTEVASRTPATEPPHVPSFVLSYASRTAC